MRDPLQRQKLRGKHDFSRQSWVQGIESEGHLTSEWCAVRQSIADLPTRRQHDCGEFGCNLLRKDCVNLAASESISLTTTTAGLIALLI
jgi:hypothetical protein